ncbi:hypothetical protein Golob_005853, partial [Gossypium lobatum]|nr:hypothetical protein [Gossypium lobatum]
EVATEREWTNFCSLPEEPIITHVVKEFYPALKEKEEIRPFYEMRSFVKVRGVNVLPTTDVSTINLIHAIIAYGILQKKQICIGTWIYRNKVEFPINLEKGIFIPHLITELCKRAGVPIERLDKMMNPLKKPLGYNIYMLDRLHPYGVAKNLIIGDPNHGSMCEERIGVK